MGKTTKRERKFLASGGVKARLQKGTITKKGKLRKRKRGTESAASTDDTSGVGHETNQSSLKLQRSDDLLSKENLADLDMDAFFAEFADKEETVDRADVDLDRDSESDEGDHEEEEEEEEEEEAGDKENDSSDSSDEEVDIEAAEARMKDEMENMASADPEFHQFLQENEQSLLEYGKDDDGVREDDETSDNEGESRKNSDSVLTNKVLSSLVRGSFQSHGIRTLKKLVGAYKTGCHLSDVGSEDTVGRVRPGESGKNYVIESSKVYDRLMVTCLSRCHEEFRYHLLPIERTKDDESALEKPINPKVLERAEKWMDMKPILLSFFRSTLHVMGEAKEPELLTMILKVLSKYLPFLSPFPSVAESMLKCLTSIWSAPLDSSEDYQVVRLNAFLRVRQLALTQPFPFIEDCLKKTYLAYTRRAKFGTAAAATSALPTLTFMGNSLVELYSLDYHSSYQHAFVYIRQLALLLRTALQKKTPEAIQQVYCWQYMHSLKLWTAVLSAASQTDDGASLRSLIYPLTEIIFGTSRLSPSPRFLPLRLQCVRLLQQLAACTEVFIPTTSILLDCLDLRELYVQPKRSRSGSSTTRGIELYLMLRLPSSDGTCLRTHEQLEAAVNEIFLLLNREVDLYRYSAGFPEFSIRIVQRLRRFAKEVRPARWKTFARACIEICERNASFVMKHRTKLEDAPKDVRQLECLRPNTEPTMRERHNEATEKERRSREALVDLATKKSPPGAGKQRKSQNETKSGKKKRIEDTKRAEREERSDGRLGPERSDYDAMEEADDVHEGIDWSSEEESE